MLEKLPKDDAVQRLFDAVEVDVTPRAEHKEALRRRLLEAAGQQPWAQAAPKTHHRPLRPLYLVKWAWAVAAMAVLAVVGWFILGGRAPTALADLSSVLRTICDAHTVTYDYVMHVPGMESTPYHASLSAPDRLRMECDEKVSVMDYAHRKHLVLNLHTKKALLLAMPESFAAPGVDTLSRLRKLNAANGRLLGKQLLDGKPVLVYEVSQYKSVVKIFVTSKDECPVRIEIRTPREEGGEVLEVMDRIVWDPVLDESLFSLEIPDGYTSRLGSEPITEQSLLEMLSASAELNHGLFPDAMDLGTFSLLIMHDPVCSPHTQIVEYNENESVTSGEVTEIGKAIYTKGLRGLAYIDQLKLKGPWHYCGQGVKLHEHAPVCWWPMEGGQNCRVIYGDLTAEELPLEQAPPVPQ